MTPHDIHGNWRASGDLGSIEALLMICSCSEHKAAEGLMLRGCPLIVIFLSSTHRGGQQPSDPFSAFLSGILFPFWVLRGGLVGLVAHAAPLRGPPQLYIMDHRNCGASGSTHARELATGTRSYHDNCGFAGMIPDTCLRAPSDSRAISSMRLTSSTPRAIVSKSRARAGMRDVSVVRWRFNQPPETKAVTRFPWRRRQQRLVGEPRLGLSDQGF
ncbi:hypothetical protein F4775DRAFT_591695 [Biscogniauxia sp. FL1348]|nr:hypothetical protein F4775DRAFT_591695 [Biscogniauxia sp. FL1348]